MATPPFLTEILKALQQGQRGAAAALIRDLSTKSAELGDLWLTVARIAAQIGEKSLALECVDLYARTDLHDTQRMLNRAGLLAELGNINEALAWVEPLQKEAPNNPSLSHFLGTAYSQIGAIEDALEQFRNTLHLDPTIGQTWLSLAALKSFTPDDPEYRQLEELYPKMAGAPDDSRAAFLYALGKARNDIGEFGLAIEAYSRGAKIKKRTLKPYDHAQDQRQVSQIINGSTISSLDSLSPNETQASSTVFVLGWPRSGTTLTEHILSSHSEVTSGGELNLFGQAHLEVGGIDLQHLVEYAGQFEHSEMAWQRLYSTYSYLLKQRFGEHDVIVDKSLNNSRFLASIYLCQPNAPIIWLDRAPEDAAWSCFKTYFNRSLEWTWSFDDIGKHLTLERQLFQHWSAQFGDRILRVPYEDLTSSPNEWIGRILSHCQLPYEEQVTKFYQSDRAVQTASVAQVRNPINRNSIGSSRPYESAMRPFFKTYRD